MSQSTQRIRSRMQQRAFAKKVPTEAFLVVTERCHLRCQQCYLVENPRPELDTATLCDLIDQLAAAGTTFLVLTGGEPLLRPDIYKLIRRAKQHGMVVYIFTTATSCNEDRVAKLVEAGLARASISLYAADPAIHDEVTQIPGSFHKTIAGIKNLVSAGIAVELKFLQMTTNIEEMLPTRALALSLGTSFRVDFGLTVCHDGRRDPLELQVQEEVLLHLYQRLAQLDPEGLGKITPKAPKLNQAICIAAHTRIIVGTDGEVYPCLDYNIPIGHVKEQSIAEIWQGEVTKTLRQRKRFEDPICRTCPDKRFCDFCPGQALLDTGDPTSPSATTCMTARVRRQVYEAVQSGQLEVKPPPIPIMAPKSGCQQCSSGLQQELEALLAQPPLFAQETKRTSVDKSGLPA